MAITARQNYDPQTWDEGIKCEGPGAKQADIASCDVNKILARYIKTGVIEHVNSVQAAYGDFSSIEDYQNSLNKIAAAEEAFMELPAEIRSKFENDPSQLLGFLKDPKNLDEAVKLGLVNPPTEKPTSVPKPASAAATTTAP